MQHQHVAEQIGVRRAAGRLTVPVLPAVASVVLGVINDPAAGTQALVRVISRDQSLAAHVLKYANAPLLRTGTVILSVDQAIARLGTRIVADVVFAACIGPRLFKAPLYNALIARIWEESLATALWSKEVAQAREQEMEASFLCGLLHQIGLPVVLQAVQEILGPAPQPALAREELDALLQSFGVIAGLDVASRWKLPEPIVETIAHLNEAGAAGNRSALVAGVSAARAFALAMLDESQPQAQTLSAMPQVQAAGLDHAAVEQLLTTLGAVREMLRPG
jgi:HD-like signal output (HDOD) protein